MYRSHARTSTQLTARSQMLILEREVKRFAIYSKYFATHYPKSLMTSLTGIAMATIIPRARFASKLFIVALSDVTLDGFDYIF